MEFTNASLEKVNDALKVVNEFTAEVIARAEKWLEHNWRDNYDLPDPHIVFNQEGWEAQVDNVEKILNDTTDAPVRIILSHPEWQVMPRSFEVPYSAIFTEA